MKPYTTTIKKYKSVFFSLFLPFYLAIQLIHAWEFILNPFLWIGILVATLAHAQKNILTIPLLFGHMAIEWFEWGSMQILFWSVVANLFHAGMDFTFFNHEIKVHLKRNPKWILSGVLLLLLFIFLISSQIKISEEILEILHPFVLGGVVGCVLSHMYFHFTKEHKYLKYLKE